MGKRKFMIVVFKASTVAVGNIEQQKRKTQTQLSTRLGMTPESPHIMNWRHPRTGVGAGWRMWVTSTSTALSGIK